MRCRDGTNNNEALCTKQSAQQHSRHALPPSPPWASWSIHSSLHDTRVLLLQRHSSPDWLLPGPSLLPLAINHSDEEAGRGFSPNIADECQASHVCPSTHKTKVPLAQWNHHQLSICVVVFKKLVKIAEGYEILSIDHGVRSRWLKHLDTFLQAVGSSLKPGSYSPASTQL